MNRFAVRFAVGLFIIALMPLGCLRPQFDIETIKSMMPERPAELDQLDALLGRWETNGTINMIGLDEPIAVTGTSEAKWECDRRFLVDQAQYDLGPLGPMTGISIWTWDQKSRKFRMWWYDSFGETATGTATYRESTKTWHIRTKGRNAWCNIVNRGTIRLLDEKNLEWTWAQWDAWHIWNISKMSGTSRRQ